MFTVLVALQCQPPVEYQFAALKNGLRVYIVEKESPVTSVIFRLNCGTVISPPQLSSLTNRMLLKGSEIRSGYQIFQETESMGGILGAEESKTSNLVFLTVPSQNFIECFKIFNECLCKPTFGNELAAISELKRINQSAENILFSKRITQESDVMLHNYLFQNSLLQKKNEKVERLYTQEEMKSFYQQYYLPSQAVMCIVGQFKSQEVLSIVKSYWEAKESHSKTQQSLELGHTSTAREYSVEENKDYERILIGYRAPEAYGEHFYETCLLKRALASGQNSLFYHSLNQDSDYHYDPLSFYHYEPDYGYFVILVETMPGQSKEVMTLVLDQINEICEEGVPERYFEIAKRKLISDVSNQFQYSLKNAFMISLATQNNHTNFYRFPPYTELEKLNHEKVNEAARRLFKDPVIIRYIVSDQNVSQ